MTFGAECSHCHFVSNNDFDKEVLLWQSYIEDGSQKVEDGVYGKSITDPCLGWDKTKDMIFTIAEQL